MSEDDLTQEERRAVRCSEIIFKFDLKSVQEDIRDTAEHLVYLKQELEDRRQMLGKLDAGDMRFMERVKVRLDRADHGEKLSAVSAEDHRRLERLWEMTLPYTSLTPEEEYNLRERLERAAKKAYKEGFTFYRSIGDREEMAEQGEKTHLTFKTLDEAREFMGLAEATAGEEEYDGR